MAFDTDTLIVGGGLSGLSLATKLHAAGRSFQLIEARPRFGGRILSQVSGEQAFDMGPAWFWAGQPRMAGLIEALGLSHFEQYATGELTYEDAQGVQRGRGYASMEGSFRVEGGLGRLIQALVARLDKERLARGTELKSLRLEKGAILAETDQGQINAKSVVLALPPRIAAGFAFDPPLPDALLKAMEAIPTWMAGHAKAMAIYETPFWREAGLSGDAMSRIGPMMELHDASPASGAPYALFGFMGVPPDARRDEAGLRNATLAQLERLFGAQASAPAELYIKDWAFDRFTATPLDFEPVYAHPPYGLPEPLSGPWDGRLILGSTEVAHAFGGYLEGALEAAEQAFEMLERA